MCCAELLTINSMLVLGGYICIYNDEFNITFYDQMNKY